MEEGQVPQLPKQSTPLSGLKFVWAIFEGGIFITTASYVSWAIEKKISNTWDTGGLEFAFWFFIPWLFALMYLLWRSRNRAQLLRFMLILAGTTFLAGVVYPILRN